MNSGNNVSPVTQSFIITQSLERIGAGNCGSVWGTMRTSDQAYSNMPLIIKREDASRGRDINNEVRVQSQVFETGFSQTSIPRCLGLVLNEDTRWGQFLPHLPPGSEACRAMLAEKIEPVPLEAQQILVEMYAPVGYPKSSQLEHCLVRIYLGRLRQSIPGKTHHGPQFFSLRNIPLHADQVEELELPRQQYAQAMAEALAILHWKVRTNAADVEFVLGAPRAEKDFCQNSPGSLRECVLWILDFDCCRPIEMDESDLESIAKAFWRNDPYYPRPGSTHDRDEELWDIFASEYRRMGYYIAQTCAGQGESAAALCNLVDGAITKIENTKGLWQRGAHV